MIDGQESLSMSEPIMILGKRGVQQREENCGVEVEERTSKREKVQVDGHECKAAGVHEHPCQAQ